jgi:hypothetical protein
MGERLYSTTVFFHVIKIFIGMGRGERREWYRMMTDINADVKVTVALAGDVRKGENFVARSLST